MDGCAFTWTTAPLHLEEHKDLPVATYHLMAETYTEPWKQPEWKDKERQSM